MGDAGGVQEQLLGPSYTYYKYIKTPEEIGMSDKGNLKALGKDVDGLIAYVELLVSGKSKASATGQPLGNKFFLKTGGKCIDTKTKEEQDRYIYVNNVPSGNIPFISNGMGVNFSEFRGLIPGTISNLNVINPFAILQAFMAGGTPDCREMTMETIDTENRKSQETHFLTEVDVRNMDPCSFNDGKNPLTGAKCRETFANSHQQYLTLPDDTLTQVYFGMLASLGIYLIYKVSMK